ncbi:hypothetical protein BEWA_000450 [Theileria equi strain WA]|uniref:Uncharacterized protein n=1 Tax=Theileria equi strain WA TaxID=1537102 RepID=L0AYJ7_THEEQ|nr:hypothetical protein BEWA_000450 [Theileria equi strain WA]AFZ80640.1 hypothetical protein BEWA_000450 [Theileria equi strain WA]|eukprot:XP_004830306.1 hypothetical protein BEWA_000450 [Theileria equi strain WA]
MRRNGKVLTLDFSKRPEEDDWECLSTCSNIPGIEATKDKNKLVNSFTKYHYKHNSGNTFTLITSLGGGHNLRGRGGNILEVTVYYWNSGDHTPILLGIKDKTGKTKYYSYTTTSFRGTKQSNWSPSGNNDNNSLEYLLDWRNCSFHAAIPFDIQNPADPSKLYTDKKVPPCMNNYRNIRESDSQSPKLTILGYDVKEYTVHNNDKNPPGKFIGTKISRVT